MAIPIEEQEKFKLLNKKEFLENSLLHAQKMEALGILACGIAHDFNNILTAMIGYTELSLAEVPPDSRVKQNLWEILQAGRRAKELINQILRFRREEEEEKKVIQIVPIIKEVCRLLRVSSPPHIKVELQTEEEGYLIKANPTHIYQILMNLCLNALQAMGNKGGVLEISLSSFNLNAPSAEQYGDLKPGLYLCLTVKDTGEGMTPEIRQRIFDPYFTTKKDGKGSGLGLSIVQGLVKGYKGTISVFSEPGKGSMFQIYLPAIDHKIFKDFQI